jgi:hypothetical protein
LYEAITTLNRGAALAPVSRAAMHPPAFGRARPLPAVICSPVRVLVHG